ncbi:MAG: carbamoyl-phosphate synthase large subunit [Bacteriovoracaceae bacterium]|jgi:carbamoyl-phosphate synthase large subunit|nr:carbamoyl-phosphate synthase large subunit [Bacteriovoracaceae bacterium]
MKKVLVIGSGPIIIGQAAEFDYSGSQALGVLKEMNIKSVLINPNPATIMTDKAIADTVYMEPLDLDTIKRIIIKENPCGILSSFGGQSALNIAKDLASDGFLDKHEIKLLGCNLDAIKDAEDRFLFRNKMIEIGINVADGKIVEDIDEGVKYANIEGYPLIIRPAYTLGGAGGGFVHNESELRQTLKSGINQSQIGQCLLEKSIKGHSEIEFEIIRDSNGNCISVCHMENIDPVGIHTGESIVICPIQSLSDKEIQKLRSLSFEIVSSLKIIGACNVQLAYDKYNSKSYVIEVNPRVSRSSALASKATGYPIAKIAAKIALGQTLDKIKNPITKDTYASFEPAIDYVITKLPSWPFNKFKHANNTLGTQMKSTGETMAIGRNFTQSFLKALRSIEDEKSLNYLNCFKDTDTNELLDSLKRHTSYWYLELMELIRRKIGIETLQRITKLDPYFLYQFEKIIGFENEIRIQKILNAKMLTKFKNYGFTNEDIKNLNPIFKNIETELQDYNINPIVKCVDTCAAEFESTTPYYYQSYGAECENIKTDNNIVVIGSGPIRIGQGIEFDYSCVHALIELKKQGFTTIMINNNPETCSTDFSMSDKLYFEPLYHEDVINILKREKPKGVLVQFGGQTAINLSKRIEQAGFKLLGISSKTIDLCEDRKQFDTFLDKLKINRPKANSIEKVSDLENFNLDFPVMARPSFVIGGMDMKIIFDINELKEYIGEFNHINSPILVDEYIKGKEIEVDAITDSKEVFIPAILEHIERAGVHSGDSICVYPPQNLYKEVIDEVKNVTKKIALGLGLKGVINIQFTYKKGKLYVLEVNPRASRTVPFISKVTDVNIASLATQMMLGLDLNLNELKPKSNRIAVKVPVFSFSKLKGLEPSLGPIMKSTGEVMGIDTNFEDALHKGLKASGIKLPSYGKVLMTISDRYKDESVQIAKDLCKHGFKIYATKGTHENLINNQIDSVLVKKENDHLISLIKNKKVSMVINTLSKSKHSNSDGFKIRTAAIDEDIPCFTSIDTIANVLKIYDRKLTMVMEL